MTARTGPRPEDVPEHLVQAAMDHDLDYRSLAAAVLAALTPDDAHLVPAWDAERAATTENHTLHVRRAAEQRARAEAAEAEVQRLREAVERVQALHSWNDLGGFTAAYCPQCTDCDEVALPCPTLRALSGTQDGGDGR